MFVYKANKILLKSLQKNKAAIEAHEFIELMFMKHYASNRCETNREGVGPGWTGTKNCSYCENAKKWGGGGGQGVCDPRIELIVNIPKAVLVGVGVDVNRELK